MKIKTIILIMLAAVLICALAACDTDEADTVSIIFINSGTATTLNVTPGSAVTPPEPAATEGMTFDGWYITAGDVSYKADFDSFTADADTVMIAKWIPVTYTVSFVSDGTDAPQAITADYGSSPELPVPERTGYDFLGWYTDDGYSERFGGTVTSDVTLYAYWTVSACQASDIYDRFAAAVVHIKTYDMDGDPVTDASGFFISADGKIVINALVLREAAKIVVYPWNSDENSEGYEVTTILGYKADLVLAIIKADIEEIGTYFEIATGEVTVGDKVFAIGNPEAGIFSLTEGIVATAPREIDGNACIQVTAPVPAASNGGPIINAYGQVVGITTTGSGDSEGIYSALDISCLDDIDMTESISTIDMYYQTAMMIPWEINRTETDKNNDTPDGAQLLDVNAATWASWLDPLTDVDYFKVAGQSSDYLTMLVLPQYDEFDAHFENSVLTLTDADGNVLATGTPIQYYTDYDSGTYVYALYICFEFNDTDCNYEGQDLYIRYSHIDDYSGKLISSYDLFVFWGRQIFRQV